jgi:CRISP-associated protein Cas1
MYSLPNQKDRILILYGAVDLRMEKGRLRIKHGAFKDITQEYLHRGTNNVDHIVILSDSGYITLEAINWCMQMGITITMIDYHGELITDMTPPETISPLVKQRQACMSEAAKLKLAMGLMGQKLAAQYDTMKAIKIDRERIKMFKQHEKQMWTCKSVEKMKEIESHAARVYWGSFEGLPLKWKPLPVQPHWLTIGNRVSPKSNGNARRAINPFQACLNYLYTVLESRVKRYATCYRLDCDYPVLHSNSRQNRSGLVYDLLEPLRPLVDKSLYQYLSDRTLSPKDFYETKEGVCRVSVTLATQIIELIKGLEPNINQTVKDYQGHFKSKMRDVTTTPF